MAERDLIEMPRPVPGSVTFSPTEGMRFSPNDIRALKAQTGKTLTELTSEGADDADRMQTMAWLRLRRQGHDVAWDRVGDTEIVFEAEKPDPTPEER